MSRVSAGGNEGFRSRSGNYFLAGPQFDIGNMKFIADGMLGKLARWLRLAGHDVVYIGDLNVPASEQDDTLLSLSKSGKRVLLTRDIALHCRARRAGIKSTLIEGSAVVEQLVEVSKRCGSKIRIQPESSRCPMCNGLLELAGKEEIRGKIPATVLRAQSEFWRCVKCGKLYWHGKHWKTILEMASRYNRMVK